MKIEQGRPKRTKGIKGGTNLGFGPLGFGHPKGWPPKATPLHIFECYDGQALSDVITK